MYELKDAVMNAENAPIVWELVHVFLTLGFIVRKFTAGGCSTMHIFLSSQV